ncbi:MAG: MBL fold metallo-hydrolase [Bacteroidia bacterium]|nr:MBL fold metallo-hydrolase [Bacteroidia bacterium]
MKLTFLGTGTSQGIPVIGCYCDVCQSTDPKDKRLRSSVHIQTHKASVVIDTGPDFRQQCLQNRIDKIDGILYTHEHMDHVSGLDDVRPYNFFLKSNIRLYAETAVENAIRRIYRYAFDEGEKYPGVPEIEISNISEKSIITIGDLQIKPFRVFHKELPVLGFKINDVTYITDANYISDDVIDELRNCKILIINALRKEKHISHFNLDEALNMIKRINPERAYLTHISHQLGKHNDVINILPINVKPAYDGLQIIV